MNLPTTRTTLRAVSLILMLVLAIHAARWHSPAGAAAPKQKPPMPPTSDKQTSDKQAAAGDALARALFGELAGRQGNLAVSPASIESCILLALAGARGDTAAEIARALKLNEKDAQNVGRLLDRGRARVADATDESSAVELTIANSAWIQRGLPIHEAYRKLLESGGRAEFETVDFATAAEAARQAINAWVDQETKHKIPELFASGLLDDSTRLVLANAVYFKGVWRHPFEKEATHKRPFHRPGMPDVSAALMHQGETFHYLETDAYQAVELPYEGSDYAMVVWLPKKIDGLADVERAVVAKDMHAALDEMARRPVDLYLPRFRVDANLSLVEVLGSLGMKAAFTPAADFSAITSEPLWISAVVHQALVEVDETGTEAAAATGAVAATAAAIDRPRPVVFRADHPFMFAIRDTATGDVLFMGRVVTPEK